MLGAIQELSKKPWRGLSPVELGKLLRADFLIYGKVLRTQRLFFILYSQLSLDVEIRMVETRRGRTVWKAGVEKRFRSGDLPLHPLSLFSAAVRTGVDAGDERMQDLVERACRELAARVPEPPGEPVPAFGADVQVASFSSPELAQQKLARLQQQGFQARIETVTVNGARWHRVIIGPYSREEADRARQELAADPGARPVLLYAQ